MKTIKIRTLTKNILADTITPVSIYLKARDLFPNSILLESSDYHGNENSFSFICLQSVATFLVDNDNLVVSMPDGTEQSDKIDSVEKFRNKFDDFIHAFKTESGSILPVNGIFGYSTYDAVQHFETIKFNNQIKEKYKIPEVRYSFYKYIIAVNHFKNDLFIIENLLENEKSEIEKIESLIYNRNIATFRFNPGNNETSNLNDDEYMQLVSKGKEHCYRGDVFQIVLSRQFSQSFQGDEFNVYRALRSINPSPYLFYFDYGSYKIFGSSPEAQLKISKGRAVINPIAGTFKRTGDDEKDKQLAHELSTDIKENAEHVMLVDLARNDLSRHAVDVSVDNYREIQYYSHVLHMVSTVSGKLKNENSLVDMMMSTFPAGTLSGAPKYKAMELIDKYENQNRGYYGGAIGYIGFDGSFNHAIMIRTFLSKNNTLFYQAGAGIVAVSKEESELQEVNNKLGALKKAIQLAKEL
jgi:anthranilate synthase component 1